MRHQILVSHSHLKFRLNCCEFQFVGFHRYQMPAGFLKIFCIEGPFEDLCCFSCVSARPIFTKVNLCSTQTLLFMKTARRQSFVDFWERRGHFKLTAVVNVSPPTHITNVTFLQRTPVVSIFRLQKCRPWVYLREIMESNGDRRFMHFEWYHLQAAASGLKWKQEGWNSFGHISVLLSSLEQVQGHCYWTTVKMILHYDISCVLFHYNCTFRFNFGEMSTGLTTSMFFILIAEWFVSNLSHEIFLALNFHQCRWKKLGWCQFGVMSGVFCMPVWVLVGDIVSRAWACLLWKRSSR